MPTTEYDSTAVAPLEGVLQYYVPHSTMVLMLYTDGEYHDAFLVDYSPFLPNDTLIDAAIQTLVRQQLLVTDKDRELLSWKEFDDDLSAMESKVFKTLGNIGAVFDDKLGQVDGRQRHFFYRDCPYNDMKFEIPDSNFRVDACFTGNGPDHAQNERVLCTETAVVVDFKSTTAFEDVDMPHASLMRSCGSLQNCEKLVSAANHVMNDDPCRMWMYGITIENTKMSVWYFSRSHCVKSETFDFTKDIRTVIRVLLSFTYATREQMGYDPTVHRIKDNESQYVYEIPTEDGTRYFKTIHLLAHHKSLCITGKKTRVWKTVEVKGFEGDAINEDSNGGKEFALKDEEAYAWAPKSLRSKLEDLFKDEGYRSYFMEIECDSFNLGRSKPTSDKAILASEILQFRQDDSANSEGAETLSESDSGKGKSLEVDIAKRRSCAVKRQYRLVYSEVGESLVRVKTLDTAFAALMDAYMALLLMYLAGWMHRDVSAGNIIAVKRSGGESGGRLSDLEYAKHYRDDNASKDSKTGTAFFMPLEIHTGIPFNHPQVTIHAFEIDPFNNLPPADYNFLRQTGATSPPSPPQRAKYRFQHDLESLWWVALYILIYRVVHPPGKMLSKKVFTHNRVPTGARRELFGGAIEWALGKSLHPALKLDSIVIAMSAIPPILYQSYLMDEPVDPKALNGLYHDVFRYLALVVVTIKAKFQGIIFRPNLTVKSKKRVRSKISPKVQDGDEYEGHESSSDDAVSNKKKKTSTNTAVRP
ncbi:hypothetical protein AGABI2DRAFT_123418 [Agaricus bisporus var. bisporus H97]|uniref:hypothetical protein n=1 Tax=Agaricus bisporus var. bisporus (strain H97 / ATCC MYA-4626 / FGSC 10389) TaxID=936046 RepID=UPI00029F5ADA|nr:hypothetical protein AGABI2DRAFT_123418 [Agaricus bisporus var. bisporus H97]EKV41699.1 hypothetical protein AGABI2DRAFT_123418 [Agaricus bisporus var. bisporus H97]